MCTFLSVHNALMGAFLSVNSEKDHPELLLWHPQPPKESRSIGISTSDNTEPELPSLGTAPPAETSQHADTAESSEWQGETTHAGEATIGEGKTVSGEEKSTVGAGEATLEKGKSTVVAEEATATQGRECDDSAGGETTPNANASSEETDTVSATSLDAVRGDRGETSEKDSATSVKMESQLDNVSGASVSTPQASQSTPVEINAEKENRTQIEDPKVTQTVGSGSREAVRSQNEAVDQGDAERSQSEVEGRSECEKSLSETADLSLSLIHI